MDLQKIYRKQTPETQLSALRATIERVLSDSPFYQQKFAGFSSDDLQSLEDFSKFPFTTKDDLREAYPLGLAAVDTEQIVRIHSSSGTTGTPVIIPYTMGDVAGWTDIFARCYVCCGVTSRDRVRLRSLDSRYRLPKRR